MPNTANTRNIRQILGGDIPTAAVDGLDEALAAKAADSTVVKLTGTVTDPKALAVTARTPGTSFVVTSADGTDTSVVAYEIFEPAA